MLKPDVPDGGGEPDCQPPSGGCVLKHLYRLLICRLMIQPPSGGCVLKHCLYGVFSFVGFASRLQAAVC